jgi:hypothetical protein
LYKYISTLNKLYTSNTATHFVFIGVDLVKQRLDCTWSDMLNVTGHLSQNHIFLKKFEHRYSKLLQLQSEAVQTTDLILNGDIHAMQRTQIHGIERGCFQLSVCKSVHFAAVGNLILLKPLCQLEGESSPRTAILRLPRDASAATPGKFDVDP